MFDVEACYKVIFEALFEQQGIENIVKRINEYTNAYVYLVLNSGEILACSCAEEEKRITSMQLNHITIRDYDCMQINIRKTEESLYSERWNKFYNISEFEVGTKKIGYSILVFDQEEQKKNIGKVNEILCMALGMYYKDTKTDISDNIPIRRQICSWSIFVQEACEKSDLELLRNEIPGEYFLTYIPCKDAGMDKKKIYQQLQGMWNKSFFLFTDEGVYTFYWGIDSESQRSIISELKKSGMPVCISEKFSELKSCSQKKEFLKRMDSLDGYKKSGGVMQEKHWYVETIFSYASSMFQDAGLSDYFIERLCQEDSEKNLELYDTLKMYLLCENNISATAAKLHVHRNTLVYRLKQIQNCVGRNINDAKVSKELLSFMIMYDIARKAEKE